MKKTKSYTYILVAFVILAIMAMSAASVNAAIEDSAIISINLVNQDPDPATAGDIVNVRLGVQNIGGRDSGDIMVEFVPEYPFQLLPGESAVQEVGIISGYQGYDDTQSLKIIKYKVLVDKDATAGSYELKTKYYEKGSLSPVQKSLSIDVSSRESAEIIHIDKTTLMPGQQSSLKFVINNVGNAPLRDLTFYWTNDDNIVLPVGSDNTRYIKYIDVGGSAELDYQVIADTNAQAGLYKLDLFLSYYDSLNNSEKQISTIAGIYVGGGTDFDVAYSDSSTSQTSFSISNIGSNPANSVSVIIPEQRGWRVSGSNSVIVGNLNKGDYTVASFKLQSTASTAATGFNRTSTSRNGNGNNFNDNNNATTSGGFRPMTGNNTANAASALIVQIAYTDTMGNRNVIEKTVNIGSQLASSTLTSTSSGTSANFTGRRQSQSFLSTYKWYIIGIVVLGVAGFFIYKRQKGKKMKMMSPDLKMKEVFKNKNK